MIVQLKLNCTALKLYLVLNVYSRTVLDLEKKETKNFKLLDCSDRENIE